jgi:hypothetical protein
VLLGPGGSVGAKHACADATVSAAPREGIGRLYGLSAATGRNCGMMIGGVRLEDRDVRALASILERPLRRRLEQALLFRAKVLALTRDEKAEVLSALERAPGGLEEVRELLLADETWQVRRRRLA